MVVGRHGLREMSPALRTFVISLGPLMSDSGGGGQSGARAVVGGLPLA